MKFSLRRIQNLSPDCMRDVGAAGGTARGRGSPVHFLSVHFLSVQWASTQVPLGSGEGTWAS